MQMALPYLAVPSCEAVAQRWPSTVVQTCTTQPVCPSSTCAQLPLTTSHTRAVKSSEAVRTRRPSGVSATDHTAPARRDPAARGTCILGIQPRSEELDQTGNESLLWLLVQLQKKHQPGRRKRAAGQHRTSSTLSSMATDIRGASRGGKQGRRKRGVGMGERNREIRETHQENVQVLTSSTRHDHLSWA